MDVLRQVIGSEPPILEDLAPHVPPETGEVLRRAMSKNPDLRFASITDFAAALLRSSGMSLPPPIDAIGVANTLPAGPPAPSSPHAAPERLTPPRPASDRFETGLRERSTLLESASAPQNPGFTTQDLARALDQARQAHGMGDIDLAVNNAETALLVAESLGSAEAQARMGASSTLLNAIFEARLGPLSQRMVVLTPGSHHKRLRVSPEQAFLLSRVDGGVTLDEAIDLSPLPRQKTLRLLVSMMRQGLIAAE
jgi:hypothetical protein